MSIFKKAYPPPKYLLFILWSGFLKGERRMNHAPSKKSHLAQFANILAIYYKDI